MIISVIGYAYEVFWKKYNHFTVGKKAYLVIKGKKEGTGKILVSAYLDGDYKSVDKYITVKVNSVNRTTAKKLYEYIKNEGYDFGPGFRYFRDSNIYIKSDSVITYGDDGKKYRIEYYVTGYDGKNDYFCFCMKRKRLDTYESYEDYTCIPVRIGKKTENASYIQEYECGDYYGDYANYVETCDIKYATYKYNGNGLSNFAIGWDQDEPGAWYIGPMIRDTMKGVKKLLRDSVGIDISDLGFTSIK